MKQDFLAIADWTADEIKGLSAQRDAKASEMGFIEEELSSLEGLYKKGHVTKARMLALRREASSLKGDHGQFIYVSPAKNLIIVRNGLEYGYDWSWADWIEAAYQFASGF